MDDIIQEKRLIILSQVRDEVKAKNDSLHHWISTYDDLVIPTTAELLTEVQYILKIFHVSLMLITLKHLQILFSLHMYYVSENKCDLLK